jgi:F-type H+-transporting ATPase subunit delta
MIVGSLARRYARALLDIAVEKGNFEKVGQEIDELATMYGSSRDLVEALTNPVFAMAKRRAVLVAVLDAAKASPVVRNFALLLLDRERIPYLPMIARELRAMVDARAGRVRAVVTSAKPITADQQKQLLIALETAAGGKKVTLEKKEDPSLVGGMVAKIGDTVYDGSIRTQLERMRERFLQD